MSDLEWSPGLLGCLNDDEFMSMRCCASFIFPHAQVLYQIRALKDVNTDREITVSDCLCTFCCLSFMVCVNRNEIRNRYNFDRVKGSGCNDCLASCYCTPCAIHQNSIVIHRNENFVGGLFMEDYDPLKVKNTQHNNNNNNNNQHNSNNNSNSMDQQP